MHTSTHLIGRPERRRPIAAGIVAMLPLLAAVAPLGLVVGAAAGTSRIGGLAAWSTSWTVYGATAQLVTMQLLDQGAGAVVVVGTLLVVNLRLAFYGGTMAPHWRSASRPWRLLASYLLVEPSYAIGSADAVERTDPVEHRAYYTAAALTLWVGWQLVTAIGLLGGERITAVVPAKTAVSLALVVMVVRVIGRSAAATIAAITAAVIGAASSTLPLGTGTLAAAAVGVAVALSVDRGRS